MHPFHTTVVHTNKNKNRYFSLRQNPWRNRPIKMKLWKLIKNWHKHNTLIFLFSFYRVRWYLFYINNHPFFIDIPCSNSHLVPWFCHCFHHLHCHCLLSHCCTCFSGLAGRTVSPYVGTDIILILLYEVWSLSLLKLETNIVMFCKENKI